MTAFLFAVAWLFLQNVAWLFLQNKEGSGDATQPMGIVLLVTGLITLAILLEWIASRIPETVQSHPGRGCR